MILLLSSEWLYNVHSVIYFVRWRETTTVNYIYIVLYNSSQNRFLKKTLGFTPFSEHEFLDKLSQKREKNDFIAKLQALRALK